MSDLPKITYTDSEGRAFNFMSDLDDVRDYQRVLVPRTTPEEPQHYTPELISSSESIDIKNVQKTQTNKFSYADIVDVWEKANKYLTGTISFTDGGSSDFKLSYEKYAAASIPGVISDPIDESISQYSLPISHNFTKTSELVIDYSSESGVGTLTARSEFELDNLYYYSGYRFAFASRAGEQLVYQTDYVDAINELEGLTVTINFGTSSTTLTINDVEVIGDRVLITYNVDPLYGNPIGTTFTGKITSEYDDGTIRYCRRQYSVPTSDGIIGGSFVYGYRENYYSEYILTIDEDQIAISNVDGASVSTSAGEISIESIDKSLSGTTMVLTVVFKCPTETSISTSSFHYSNPSETAIVYISELSEFNGINSQIRLKFPNSDDFTINNVVLNADVEYEDDGIYGNLFYCGRIINGSFHEFDWNASTSDRQFGTTINGWTKTSKEYTATLAFGGTDEERRLALNRFHSAIENDIVNESPGTLSWDDATISCYIRSSVTRPSETLSGYTENEITIYCPRPFWEHIVTSRFYSESETFDDQDTEYLKDWPHDYSGYDYKYRSTRQSLIYNDGPVSDWQIVINGPAQNPIITIGNNIIAMNTTIPTGADLLIDSRDKYIYLIGVDGSMDNRFGERNLENYIFEKIEPGENKVTWNGTYEWLLTLYEERSEPRWQY